MARLPTIESGGLDQQWQWGWKEVEVFGGVGEKINAYWCASLRQPL